MPLKLPVRMQAVLHILELQLIIVLYTCASLTAKVAASFPWLSFEFFFYYGIELLLLVIYALLWQQVIKKFTLSAAYANRGTAVFWSMIWSALIFQENVSLQNFLGVAVIFIGITLINTEKRQGGG